MTRNRLVFIISLLVFLTVLGLLITGSNLLTISLAKNPEIPLGNMLTWLGLMAFPLMLFTGIRSVRQPRSQLDKAMRLLLWVSLFLAVLWPFVSFYLADNWSFNFKRQLVFRGSDRAGRLFWYNNYLLSGLPIAIFLIHTIRTIIKGLLARK